MAEVGAIDDGDAVELTIGGKTYGGWTSIRISADLDSGARSFDLGVTVRDPAKLSDRFDFEAGAAATVAIGAEIVVTGYVDGLDASMDSESHSITVRGRSAAADLLDCSAIAKPGSWSGSKLEAIAAELAKPFGVTISAVADTGAAFRKFALQQGETVWEVIARLCSHRGLLAVSRADGVVEIVTPKPAGAAVKVSQGVHPLAFSATHDMTQRFSEYRVKGQSAGDDTLNGKAASAVKGEAKDPAVKRYRPLLVIADEQVNGASAAKRAEFEATVRAAKSQTATVVLPGWRRVDGKLWAPMDAVDPNLPGIWITGAVMVAGVDFQLDDGGRRSELRLVRPEAYSQLPVPDDAEASAIGKAAAA